MYTKQDYSQNYVKILGTVVFLFFVRYILPVEVGHFSRVCFNRIFHSLSLSLSLNIGLFKSSLKCAR